MKGKKKCALGKWATYVYLFYKQGLIIATRSIIPFVMSTPKGKKSVLGIRQTSFNNSNTCSITPFEMSTLKGKKNGY